ncbi:MAG TPA: response regulator transcription factor [Thermoanaerobaculia bacterium]|nr:response regulator transcription factor [Thermoanaerobaculia bacterium]
MSTAPDRRGRIALVDDEPNLRETVGYALAREGYRVDAYGDGAAAWEAWCDGAQRPRAADLPDLVVLDILMPRMDGLELCRRLRGVSETLPILFLSSKDEEIDRVLGLELGADDYLVKPFSMRELVARVKVLFRRLALLDAAGANGESEGLLAAGELVLDLDRYQASWRDRPLGLTVTEFLILRALARRPGHVKSREQLIAEGYPHDTYVADRTIDSHIKRLRKKLVAASGGGDPIETVYGIGYRFGEASGAGGRTTDGTEEG